MINDSTIAAIATPVGNGGIGIVKISGKKALSVGLTLFRRFGYSPDRVDDESYLLRRIESHRLNYGYVIDPGRGSVIDEVLFTVMKAPRSYTGEDVVEFHSHGGTALLQTILELVLKFDVRLAHPGEFTRRAFVNGRIDLTQAEAVIDMINATSRKALESAANQLKGEFSHQIHAIRQVLIDMLAQIDAVLDFPEDVDDIVNRDSFVHKLQAMVMNPIRSLIEQYENQHVYRDGAKAVIVGRPNVGKSSLMNRLIQKDRVIVTPLPGTTRDFIDDRFSVADISISITDTAGLQDTQDAVEAIGIGKVYECIENSDLVLFVMDAQFPFGGEDLQIYEKIKHKPVVCVINKSDLLNATSHIALPEGLSGIPVAYVSALFNTGIDDLKQRLYSILTNDITCDSTQVIPNLRHKEALKRSADSIRSAMGALLSDMPLEVIAIDIREGLEALSEILGICIGEEILDHIFSRFCVGK